MDDVSSVGTVLRAVLSFAAVLGLLLLAARLLRRFSGGPTARPGSQRAVQVVDRYGVGRNASVVVVRVADVPLVLGVTDTQVNLLAELDAERLAAYLATPDDPGPGGPRTQLDVRSAVQSLRDLTVRRR